MAWCEVMQYVYFALLDLADAPAHLAVNLLVGSHSGSLALDIYNLWKGITAGGGIQCKMIESCGWKRICSGGIRKDRIDSRGIAAINIWHKIDTRICIHLFTAMWTHHDGLQTKQKDARIVLDSERPNKTLRPLVNGS